jgi:hypothetical protein
MFAKLTTVIAGSMFFRLISDQIHQAPAAPDSAELSMVKILMVVGTIFFGSLGYLAIRCRD